VRVSVLSRGNHSQILNLEYLQVTNGYECLEHCMSLREIMRARATLHLSSTVTTDSISPTEAALPPVEAHIIMYKLNTIILFILYACLM